MRRSVEERFWEKVNKRGPDECWEWCGALKANGYGTFRDRRANGRWGMVYAHRHSWQAVTRSPIPDGLFVCHKCDNRRCVNPQHLWLGTSQQNQADMGKKGRTFSPAKKLTNDDVRDIKDLKGIGVLQRQVAAKFGVSRTQISRIWSGTQRS